MSFSLDLAGMFSVAASLFDAFGPVLGLIGGFALVAAIIALVLWLMRGDRRFRPWSMWRD